MKSFKKIATTLLTAGLLTGLLLSGCGGKQADQATAAGSAAETTAADENAAETAAAAAGETDENGLLEAGVFRMGLDDSLPPMGFRDDQNEIVGYDIDLAKEVTKRMGVELKPVPIDWSMKENELSSGNIDCIWNGFSYSDERNASMSLTTPYMENKQVVITMKESGITSLDQMKDKKLSLQSGSTAELALDGKPEFKDSLAEVVTFKENITAFKDIESGATDGLLTDSVMGEYYISQQADPDAYFVIDDALSVEDYVIGFKKGNTKLNEAVTKALTEMKEDGTLGEITAKWFGKDVSVFGDK